MSKTLTSGREISYLNSSLGIISNLRLKSENFTIFTKL